MMHPDVELRAAGDQIGFGVFATRPIPKGTLTWTLCELDRTFDAAAVAALPTDLRAIVHRYSYVDADGRFVLCWDFARYVNHSCEPTSLGVGQYSEVAVRDIAAGEQLTSEYGSLNLIAPLACRCGAPSCRGTIRADDGLRLGSAWDAAVGAVLPLVARVPQPLRPFVKDPSELDAIVSGARALPPHRGNYFRRA